MPIICGTDLSPSSAQALDVAHALASQRGDSYLVLAHVMSPDASDAAELAELRERLDAQARAPRGGAPGTGPQVHVELVTGAPDQALVELAASAGSDLIVIAAQSHGDRASRLGTTAAQVIARTHVPVLAVRDPAPWLAFAHGAAPLRVLLGIDDSATCDLGIQWTHALGRRGKLDVVLGAIYYADDAAAHYGLPPRGLIEADPEIERLLARDLIRRFAGSVAAATGGGDGTGVTACARRGLGRIGDHMIELARDQRVDAIVVGTGQKTGLGRLGSVSSVIVQSAPQSVVCVPPQAQITTQRVPVIQQALVATDLSQFANRAVPYAFALAQPGGEIHLIHVVKTDAEVDTAALAAQLAQLAPEGASQRVHTHIVRGDDPAITTAQCAARFGVDVICIASHGRSGISRALVGSVADRLLRSTRLPVLVLRPA